MCRAGRSELLHDLGRQRRGLRSIARCVGLVILGRPSSTVRGLLADWELPGSVIPMEATVDDVGRIVVPKPLRDRLRLTPGTKVDVSEYGDGLHIAPVGRTARIEERDGNLVAVADTPITDDDVFALVDAGRR